VTSDLHVVGIVVIPLTTEAEIHLRAAAEAARAA
jgi:hypothetical protein